MILQILLMASRTGTFKVENWKLDIVKSHFSGEKKSNSRPALNRERSEDNVLSTTTSGTVAADSPGQDLEVKSLIKELSGSIPVTPSVPTPKKRLDGPICDDNGLGISSRDKPSSFSKKEDLKQLSGINEAAGKWQALEDAIRPLKTESSANPRIITPGDDTDKDESLLDVRDQDYHRTTPSAKSIKPKIIQNKCQFPINLQSLKGKYSDQGRNCVVIFLKSHTTDSTMERERTVLKNKKKVDTVLKKFKLKYDFIYSSQTRVVYNLCFVSPTETRKFARDLSGITTSTHFLCHEEMLGKLRLQLARLSHHLICHSRLPAHSCIDGAGDADTSQPRVC